MKSMYDMMTINIDVQAFTLRFALIKHACATRALPTCPSPTLIQAPPRFPEGSSLPPPPRTPASLGVEAQAQKPGSS